MPRGVFRLATNLTLAVVAVTLLLYYRGDTISILDAQKPMISNIGEPDPTRWRHTGAQPLTWAQGNGVPVRDETAEHLFSMLN